MPAVFKHFDLRLVNPRFESRLTDVVIELNHLRKLQLSGTTAPWTFFQLKEIFHLLESVGSARIEGNRTTVAEYVEQKIERKERSLSRFSEIANVENVMSFIEQNIREGSKITNHFIRELHHLTVDKLEEEGDRTPGAFRTGQVTISGSSHLPPSHNLVQGYMDELIEFINNSDYEKYELIKTAIAHHRFAWIHPFRNGNGRVVRLLTYALLIKYGFNVKEGKILNPTAVFCNNRDHYYEMLSTADQGTDNKILDWCQYVLRGILDEITKVNRLTDHAYLAKHILIPTINFALDRRYITKKESIILKKGIELQEFKSPDLKKSLAGLSSRQRLHLIAKLKTNNLILPIKPNGRIYFVNFMNNYLMRGVIRFLAKEKFIPPIDR